MLTRTYKTAVELGLTRIRYSALLELLGMMERGEIVHVPINNFTQNIPPIDLKPTGFSMETFSTEVGECQTVCCLCGWADYISHGHFLDRTPHALIIQQTIPDSLEDLFMPRVGCWRDITVAQATRALNNYLTTGEARWEIVLEGKDAKNQGV